MLMIKNDLGEKLVNLTNKINAVNETFNQTKSNFALLNKIVEYDFDMGDLLLRATEKKNELTRMLNDLNN